MAVQHFEIVVARPKLLPFEDLGVIRSRSMLVKNNLSTVPDTERAADLFRRILAAGAEQAEEDAQRDRRNGRDAA